jgi:hypothetical protein
VTRRYLIITYSYKPLSNARAFRWTALAEYWAAQGHHIDVVCGWEAGLPHEEILNGVHVYRVNALWIEKLRRWFKVAAPSPSTAPAPAQRTSSVTSSSLSNWVKRTLKVFTLWIYKNIYRQVFWPDMVFLWYGPALRQARRLASITAYDVLISVSFHFTAHLVGQKIHQQLPKIGWLVDVGDPFSIVDFDPPNNPRLYKGLNRRMERNILREASRISVTTQLTLDKYEANFPETKAKTVVIPPLLSLSADMKSEPLRPSTDSKKRRIVFTGSLYSSLRRPDHLLRLFALLSDKPGADQLELHFWGYISDVKASFEPYQHLIDSKIFLHGLVSRPELSQALQEASVLVNIGNKVPFQLPSKVVEYASLNKPILNLVTIADDSSSHFFRDYPAVLTILDDHNANVQHQADTLYAFIMHPPAALTSEALEKLLAPFQIDSIAAAYDKLIADQSRSKT